MMMDPTILGHMLHRPVVDDIDIVQHLPPHLHHSEFQLDPPIRLVYVAEPHQIIQNLNNEINF